VVAILGCLSAGNEGGRRISVWLKKQVLAAIVERLSKAAFDTENVMVVFQDVAWENWSPAGGRVPNA
jgi:phenylpyruvate tautomerase PptA (4-oxalocrotonate tautomerase family)